MAPDTLSSATDFNRFAPFEEGDPAIPGDPWSRVRYRYGQLMGAEDFTAEQRAAVLRHRLHLALSHGVGTVCGLKVGVADDTSRETMLRAREKAENSDSILAVAAGIAVDGRGREIYVPRQQCLEIADIHTHQRFWEGLDPSPAEGLGERLEEARQEGHLRRAYVVLSFEACKSEPAPAITPPCGDSENAFAYSRTTDRFRIDLVAKEPQTRRILSPWLESEGDADYTEDWRTPRERLLDHITADIGKPEPGLCGLWHRHEKDPLVLAAVDLLREGEAMRAIRIDNAIRALMPDAQLIAEQCFGQALGGKDARAPLKAMLIGATREGNSVEIQVIFSDLVVEKSINPENVHILAMESKEGPWVRLDLPGLEADGHMLRIEAACEIDTDPLVYQVFLNGAGPMPIVTRDGRPLAGWWDEPVPGEGRGKDISVVRALQATQ